MTAIVVENVSKVFRVTDREPEGIGVVRALLLIGLRHYTGTGS